MNARPMAFKLTYSTMFDPPEELHTRFEAALAEARAGLGASHALHVDGADVRAARSYEKFSPADARVVLGRFPLAEGQDVDRAMRAAHRAFGTWRFTPLAERVRLARRAATLIEERVYRIAAALALEVGKNRMEALGEAQETADFFAGYASELERSAGYDLALPDDPLPGFRSRNRSVLKPYGVWGVITPFNFPLALAGGPVAAALVTGNSVVLKPTARLAVAARARKMPARAPPVCPAPVPSRRARAPRAEPRPGVRRRMPMVFTSAAMAMIGKASSSKPSTTKNTSIKTTSPKVAMLTERRRCESIMTRARRGAGPAPGAPARTSRRKRNSAAGRPPVAVEVSPVGSTSAARLDQPAEILLVQMAAGDRLDRALQFGERELARHQLEHDRAVFELGAQPRDRGGEDAAVVEAHRLAQRRELAARASAASRPSRRASSTRPAS